MLSTVNAVRLLVAQCAVWATLAVVAPVEYVRGVGISKRRYEILI
jgi:hypothetical protein